MIIHHRNPFNFLFVVPTMSNSTDSPSVVMKQDKGKRTWTIKSPNATPVTSREESHARVSREEFSQLAAEMKKILALVSHPGTRRLQLNRMVIVLLRRHYPLPMKNMGLLVPFSMTSPGRLPDMHLRRASQVMTIKIKNKTLVILVLNTEDEGTNSTSKFCMTNHSQEETKLCFLHR